MLSGESPFWLACSTKVNYNYGYVTSVTATSPIYTAGGTSVPCVEQVFTKSTDPRPYTEDWTIAIEPFNPSEWNVFRMSATASSTDRRINTLPSPIARACYVDPSANNSISADFPVDGVNTGFEWKPSSLDGVYYTAETEWLPISAIASSETAQLYASVSVFNSMFDSYGSSISVLRSAWSAGDRTSIVHGSLSGAVQFGRTQSIYQYQGSSTATGSISSYLYMAIRE